MARRRNAINNNSSQLTIDPGSSGDSFIQLNNGTSDELRIGVDDSDSDKFKMSKGSVLGTNDFFVLTSNGEITMPSQACFLHVVTSNKTLVTGDGTAYGIDFDSTVFNLNMGTFPYFRPLVSGIYRIDVGLAIFGLASNHNELLLTLNNLSGGTSVELIRCDPYAMANSSTQLGLSASVLVQIDAGDYYSVSLKVSGGSKHVSVLADKSGTCSWISTSLEC